MYVFIQLSVTHKVRVGVFLATSFGSKMEPSSCHYARTFPQEVARWCLDLKSQN